MLVFTFALIAAVSLISCGDSRQENQEKTANTYTADLLEYSVSAIGRGDFQLPAEISEEDADAISLILEKGGWTKSTADSERNCAINLNGHLLYYHSHSGTFCKYDLSKLSPFSSVKQEINEEFLILSEEDRTLVNAILEKYIDLPADADPANPSDS